MKPEQLLDMRADLVARQHDPLFIKYMTACLRPNWDNEESRTDRDANIRTMRTTLFTSATMADCYRVSGDMSLLVQHAATTLDETDVFSPDLAPAPYGMVFFEQALPMIDSRGELLLAHWLVWGVVKAQDELGRSQSSSVSYWFNDPQIQPDSVTFESHEKFARRTDRKTFYDHYGRWAFIGAEATMPGQTLGPAFTPVGAKNAMQLLLEGAVPHAFTNATRYLHALWMLLGQTVTTVEPEHVRKTARRSMERRGLPARVSVIRLRHSSSRREKGESQVEWSHRWLVKGHPRWQPYGSRGDHAHVLGSTIVENAHSVKLCQITGCDYRVERIWINPFVKGPEGKRLWLNEKVYDLSR